MCHWRLERYLSILEWFLSLRERTRNVLLVCRGRLEHYCSRTGSLNLVWQVGYIYNHFMVYSQRHGGFTFSYILLYNTMWADVESKCGIAWGEWFQMIQLHLNIMKIFIFQLKNFIWTKLVIFFLYYYYANITVTLIYSKSFP